MYSLIFEITMQRAMGNPKENVSVDRCGEQRGLLQCVINVGEKAISTMMKETMLEVL